MSTCRNGLSRRRVARAIVLILTTMVVAWTGAARPADRLGIRSLSLGANDVTAGQTVTGTVTLDQPAPSNRPPLAVQLTSSSGLVQVPASIAIPPGSITATFAARTSFGRLGCATITARTGTSRGDVVLYISSVTTFERGEPAMTLRISPPTTISGSAVQGTVELDDVARTALPVRLASGNPALATLPDEVTIQQGARGATFPIATSPVPASNCVEISARVGTTSRRRLLKLATITG